MAEKEAMILQANREKEREREIEIEG